MPLFLFARFHAKAGNRERVREAILAVRAPTRAEPGCLAYSAFQSIRDADEFYVHSRWLDRAAFERHAQLPHTVAFIATVEPLVDHEIKVTLAEELA